MAKWSFAVSTFTTAPTADTTAQTARGYLALKGGSTTQRIDVLEIYIAGMASSSTPAPMVFARHSTLAVTPTALTTAEANDAMDAATAALAAPQVAFTTASTQPQRHATAGRLALGLNLFGGIVRWVAAPGSEYRQVGNAVNLGESSLSEYSTGGSAGLAMAHIVYEVW